jgi:DNA (cytosine-5)-methyltransferase 1
MKRDLMSLPLDLGSELIIDNFAGGGGASTGLERAFGRPVDVAINHDAEALTMHLANHPDTAHHCESVFDVDPDQITGDQPVGLVWLSPDCKHFSKAKGGKPVSKKIRGLAWIALRWGVKVKPRALMLENVEEFITWGPLLETADGEFAPDPARKGETFKAFIGMLSTGIDAGHPALAEACEVLDVALDSAFARALVKGLGYSVDWRELRACDYGAPTIRKRFFLVARRDHLPIIWPTPTHGNPKSDAVMRGKLLPWRTAAECIDWSIPCPSIFERKRPLKDATLRRIAKGIMKFVVNSDDPFIVSAAHSTTTGRGPNVWSSDEPLRTVTSSNDKYVVVPTVMHITHQGEDRTRAATQPLATITTANRGEQALVSATLIQTGYGERPGQEPRVPGLDKPLGTVVAGGVKHAQVMAFLAKHYGGHETPGASLEDPMSTVTSQDHHALVTAQIVGCGGRAGQSRPRDSGEPLATITSKADSTVVTSHLLKLRNNQFGQSNDDPMPTLTAGGGHVGEVRAFLIKYYGEGGQWQDVREPMHTVPTKDRMGLVTIHGEDYAIVDIGMRMLTPRELARAQGFPDSYVLDPEFDGKPLTKSSQVRMIGNSVCPDVATALIVANFSHEKQISGVAA